MHVVAVTERKLEKNEKLLLCLPEGATEDGSWLLAGHLGLVPSWLAQQVTGFAMSREGRSFKHKKHYS